MPRVRKYRRDSSRLKIALSMTILLASVSVLRARGVAASAALAIGRGRVAPVLTGSVGGGSWDGGRCGGVCLFKLRGGSQRPLGSQHLVDAAQEAVAAHGSIAAAGRTDSGPDDKQRSIRLAEAFLRPCCPQYLESELCQDRDRLVKIGRGLADLVSRARSVEEEAELGASLKLLVEECQILAAGDVTVPKVRFGRTEIEMPIVSLGTMRFQQAWGTSVETMEDVTPECQANVVNVIRYAAKLGVNHIEAARGYGSSEMQIGEALRTLFKSGELQREDLIIQTKVPTRQTASEFRDLLERSFRELQVDYFDLFSFHGLNFDHQYDLLFNNGEDGNLIDVIKEYMAKGKIRHVGFSTHAPPALIRRLIETDQFSYANIHYHWCGSYTASGDGNLGGNLEIIRLMKEKDMGVFVISVFDKGGMLYAPSKRLRSLTLPELEPIAFGSQFLWEHERVDEESAPVHTVSCGAARPSDLDQPAVAAYMRTLSPEFVSERVDRIVSKLNAAQVGALGQDWMRTWHFGLPNALSSSSAIQICNIVWLYNLIQSFGMLEFCRARYASMENNSEKWEDGLSIEENIEHLGPSWGWTPGTAVKSDTDISIDLVNVPEENKARVVEAIKFVREWCSKDASPPDKPPEDWETSHDMRPWTAFPERR